MKSTVNDLDTYAILVRQIIEKLILTMLDTNYARLA